MHHSISNTELEKHTNRCRKRQLEVRKRGSNKLEIQRHKDTKTLRHTSKNQSTDGEKGSQRIRMRDKNEKPRMIERERDRERQIDRQTDRQGGRERKKGNAVLKDRQNRYTGRQQINSSLYSKSLH